MFYKAPNIANEMLMKNCTKPPLGMINVPGWAEAQFRLAALSEEDELQLLPAFRITGQIAYLLVRWREVNDEQHIDIIGELLANPKAQFVNPFGIGGTS